VPSKKEYLIYDILKRRYLPDDTALEFGGYQLSKGDMILVTTSAEYGIGYLDISDVGFLFASVKDGQVHFN